MCSSRCLQSNPSRSGVRHIEPLERPEHEDLLLRRGTSRALSREHPWHSAIFELPRWLRIDESGPAGDAGSAHRLRHHREIKATRKDPATDGAPPAACPGSGFRESDRKRFPYSAGRSESHGKLQHRICHWRRARHLVTATERPGRSWNAFNSYGRPETGSAARDGLFVVESRQITVAGDADGMLLRRRRSVAKTGQCRV